MQENRYKIKNEFNQEIFRDNKEKKNDFIQL
jgi:hypothetical protein